MISNQNVSRVAGPITRILIFVIIFPIATAGAQDFILRLEETLSIGHQDDPNYFFSDINQVRTDREGNIYVSENRSSSIRVYEKDGTYLKMLGAPGNGPGEFRDVHAMHVNADGQIVVLDPENRRFTFLDMATGASLTIPIDDPFGIGAEAILDFRWGYLLAYPQYLDAGGGGSAPSYEDAFLHEYDANIERLESFGSAKEIFEPNDLYSERVFTSSSFNLAVRADDTIALAPHGYSNSVDLLEFDGKAWTPSELSAGPEEKGYRVWTTEEYEAYRKQDEAGTLPGRSAFQGRLTMSNGRNGRVVFDTFRISRNLFFLPDGSLLHFYSDYREEVSELIAELWDPEGNYVGKSSAAHAAFGPNALDAEVLWTEESAEGELFLYVTFKDEFGAPLLKRYDLWVRRY